GPGRPPQPQRENDPRGPVGAHPGTVTVTTITLGAKTPEHGVLELLPEIIREVVLKGTPKGRDHRGLRGVGVLGAVVPVEAERPVAELLRAALRVGATVDGSRMIVPQEIDSLQ